MKSTIVEHIAGLLGERAGAGAGGGGRRGGAGASFKQG